MNLSTTVDLGTINRKYPLTFLRFEKRPETAQTDRIKRKVKDNSLEVSKVAETERKVKFCVSLPLGGNLKQSFPVVCESELVDLSEVFRNF